MARPKPLIRIKTRVYTYFKNPKTLIKVRDYPSPLRCA